MTAGEVIAQADELRPNAYSREQKLRWLRRLDGQILAELELTHGALASPTGGGAPEGGGRGNEPLSALRATSPGGGSEAALPDSYDADTGLLAPFPWGEGLYLAWLFCQIDLHNGEIQRYNQSLALLASAWRSLADWMNRTRMPRGVPAWRM